MPRGMSREHKWLPRELENRRAFSDPRLASLSQHADYLAQVAWIRYDPARGGAKVDHHLGARGFGTSDLHHYPTGCCLM
jgi:hypothetical protein